jgi:hypothetical protein
MRILSAISCLFWATGGLASTVQILGKQEETTTTTSGDSTATPTQNTATVAAKKEKCIADLQFLGKAEIDPLDQFNTFVEDVCLGLDLRVPNGVRVASCFHTGFFLLRTLRPMAEGGDEAKEDFDTYLENFCTSYGEVLPKRTAFIQEVSGIEDSTEFTEACFNHLEKTPTLNTWFDPIDAIASIT